MPEFVTITIASDFHYAGAAEQSRRGYETRTITNPFYRLYARFYYRFIWMADMVAHRVQVDQFLAAAPPSDWLIANGDFSCDSGFTGVSDDAACASAKECLGKLRARAGDHFAATFGDHELGKLSLFSNLGGLRLASFHRAVDELGLRPFWEIRLGRYVLMGVTSSLLALPVYEREALANEVDDWRRLRENHLRDIGAAFTQLAPDDRVVLFCHDPTALPFLAQVESVARCFPQLEKTIIGHLHTPLVLKVGQRLAGMPEIRFLGHVPRRLTSALRRARAWKPFNVQLCPSLAGCQLLKDGGYLTMQLDPEARTTLRIQFHQLPWMTDGSPVNTSKA